MPEGNTVLPSDDDMRTTAKWAQVVYDSLGPGESSPFPEGNAPKPGDDEERLLKKINALTGSGGGGGGGGGVGGGTSSLLDGIISYWPLEEASGTREDIVGSNDLTDPTSVLQGAGKIGNAALFDELNSQFLTVADNASLDLTTGLSLPIWVFGNNLTANACIAAKWAFDTDGCWAIQLDSTGTGIQVFIAASAGDPGDNWIRFEDAGLTNDTWHHVVVTYDAGTVKLYVDGVEIPSSDTSGPLPVSLRNSGAPLRLGTFQGLGRFWAGLFDEAALYDRALSQIEVTELFNSNSGLAYPF